MTHVTFLIDRYLDAADSFHVARKALPPRYPDAAHDHDFFEVFLIEDGQTAHWINGETQILIKGQLVFIRPGDVHAFSADRAAGCRIMNVMFRSETARHLRDRYPDTIAGRFFDRPGRLPDMYSLSPARFARAVSVGEQLQTAQRSLARIEEFLLFLTNRVADTEVGHAGTAPHWFLAACSAVQSQEVFRKGATGLIEASGRSHEHVCRTCKTVTGLTPSEYVNRIRIEHAAHLLRSDERPIEDVVEICGFDNTSYFYRLFRRQLGTTPRQYRLLHSRDPFRPAPSALPDSGPRPFDPSSSAAVPVSASDGI